MEKKELKALGGKERRKYRVVNLGRRFRFDNHEIVVELALIPLRILQKPNIIDYIT